MTDSIAQGKTEFYKERVKEILGAKGAPATRVELCRQLLRDHPLDEFAWWSYGTALSELSLFDEAEFAFKRRLELGSPKHRDAVLGKAGENYKRKGDAVSAERWFREMIAANPDRASGYIYLGALLASTGRLDEAATVHRRGTECKAGCVDEAHHNLGLILRALGKYDEAIGHFEEALRLDPQDKYARIALRDCTRAMRIVTDSIAPKSAASQKDRWKEIMDAWEAYATRIELCRRFLQDYPLDGFGWWAYGTALSDLSLFDEAEIVLKRATDLMLPKHRFHVLPDLGRNYQRRGQVILAERLFREAIMGNPDTTLGYVYLGALLVRHGRLEEAAAVHHRATECKEGCVDEAHHNFGLILRTTGKYDDAIAHFEEALRRNPQYKHARIALKDCKRAIRIVAENAD